MRTLYAALFLASLAAEAFAMTPEEILATMEKRYAECKSYQDVGVYRNKQPTVEINLPMYFKTHYIRPDHFLFEWSESGKVRSINYRVKFRQVRIKGVVWSPNQGSY
jgi:outer membrane lipoprotein-sorting protein